MGFNSGFKGLILTFLTDKFKTRSDMYSGCAIFGFPVTCNFCSGARGGSVG